MKAAWGSAFADPRYNVEIGASEIGGKGDTRFVDIIDDDRIRARRGEQRSAEMMGEGDSHREASSRNAEDA